MSAPASPVRPHPSLLTPPTDGDEIDRSVINNNKRGEGTTNHDDGGDGGGHEE